MKIVKIALPVPKNVLFSYYLPESNLNDTVLAGRRAMVPFGKRNATGMIVGVSESVELEKLKQVVKIIDDEPVLTENLLKFTKWISEYYYCSWGIAIKAALPESLKITNKVKLLKELTDEDIYIISRKSKIKASILKLLKEHGGQISLKSIGDRINAGTIKAHIASLEKAGIVSLISNEIQKIKSKKAKAIRLSSTFNETDEFEKIISNFEKKAPRQALLLSKLKQISSTTEIFLQKDAMSIYKASSTVINELLKKSYIEIYDVELKREKLTPESNNLSRKNELELQLTNEQQYVLDGILKNIPQKNFKPVLLHGVTGSGKTLIYFHAIKHVLDKGKSVLILVPEISLTPQLIDRFQRVFPNQVAVFHSRMSAGARHDSWKSILDEEKKIVLGVRSAVFSPLKNIGLMIIDEEHEPSYKQDSPEPRYNARDAAIIRARIENAVIILGSATPSIESMENAGTKKYEFFEIKERADGAKLPNIRIINLTNARKQGRLKGTLTDDLLNAIEEKVRKKEGVILFLNRRGFAPVLECPECGHIPECDQCSVSLTYHKKTDKLHCHYCGRIYHSIQACSSCGNPGLAEIGFGTQRIEEDLSLHFQDKGIMPVIRRMDLDTTTFRGSHRIILTDFAMGKTDILVGTQMVAKGLDFERVTLVGVINADLQLYQPDFRATERTFQLITQVAGRAGRTEAMPGEVIIQTAHPANFAINAAVNNDYESFFNQETEHRKTADYPPYSRFCLIEFTSRELQKADRKSNEFYGLLPKKTDAIKCYKPFSPLVYKIRGKYRKLIIIKNIKSFDKNGKELRKCLTYALNEYNNKYYSSKVKIKIDIDSFSPL